MFKKYLILFNIILIQSTCYSFNLQYILSIHYQFELLNIQSILLHSNSGQIRSYYNCINTQNSAVSDLVGT